MPFVDKMTEALLLVVLDFFKLGIDNIITCRRFRLLSTRCRFCACFSATCISIGLLCKLMTCCCQRFSFGFYVRFVITFQCFFKLSSCFETRELLF